MSFVLSINYTVRKIGLGNGDGQKTPYIDVIKQKYNNNIRRRGSTRGGGGEKMGKQVCAIKNKAIRLNVIGEAQGELFRGGAS